jgi:hypothetical protein
MELKKNSCEEKLQITQVSYSFPFFSFRPKMIVTSFFLQPQQK